MAITAILLYLILAPTDDVNGIPRDPLISLLIGILIAVIVAYTGGRKIHYLLVPLISQVVSSRLGAFGYRALTELHLPG
ncbi:MAG: Glycerol uptake facilitator protein [Sodalis sp.]|nr:MAG: Glycerol uptake facilitator protein [Sodalis sp.]